MATQSKTDRKKLVSVSVVGAVMIWNRVDTGAELARLDVTTLTDGMVRQLVVYGAKQIASDVVSAVDGEEKFNGIVAAVAALGAGTWPRRPSAPASFEPAIAALMAIQKIDRPAALKMLGLPTE